MIRVMIVEDDFRIANIHAEIVNELEGFTVVHKVLNATDALHIISSERIDLLLLDVYLPDKLGVDVLWELRKNKQYVDVIIVTAAMEKEILKPLLRLGVFDILFKPLEVSRLTNTLHNYKAFYNELQTTELMNQSFIDQLFYNKELHSVRDEEEMPKGIDRITLEKVQSVMEQHSEGLTAEDVAEKSGTSRTTARRYLEYLISIGVLVAEQEYGIVGRPLRKYKTTK